MGTEISPMQLKVAVALVATLVAAASAFSTTPSLALRRSTPAASTRRPTVLALSMQEDKENATPEDQENATPESVTPVKQTTGFGKLGKNLMIWLPKTRPTLMTMVFESSRRTPCRSGAFSWRRSAVSPSWHSSAARSAKAHKLLAAIPSRALVVVRDIDGVQCEATRAGR